MSTKKLSFSDVCKFAAGYWHKQPKKLFIIISMVLTASLLEAYLPSALSSFLGSIRENGTRSEIINYLLAFLGIYVIQALFFSFAYLLYNSFETTLFKSLIDDAFAHVERLPEQFFVNTFTGSIISKITRARTQIEIFEDQILIRIFTTAVILFGSIIFLAFRFPLLALLMFIYLVILIAISAFLVFKISGPAQSLYADAQDSYSAHLADSISGIATTKAYAEEKS